MQATNWASKSNGASIVDVSSEIDGCPAENILNANLPSIWLTEEGLPQWVCISLKGMKEADGEPIVLRSVGWHCWHQYTTNPRVVTIHVSSDSKKFKLWDTFTAGPLKGLQLFCCAPLNSAIYPYVALEVTDTFGGRQTYMNEVFLYSDEYVTNTSPMPSGTAAAWSNVSKPTPYSSAPSAAGLPTAGVSVTSGSPLDDALGLRGLEVSLAGSDIASIIDVDEGSQHDSDADILGWKHMLSPTMKALEHTEQQVRHMATHGGTGLLREEEDDDSRDVTVEQRLNNTQDMSPTLRLRTHTSSSSAAAAAAAATATSESNEGNKGSVLERLSSLDQTMRDLIGALVAKTTTIATAAAAPSSPTHGPAGNQGKDGMDDGHMAATHEYEGDPVGPADEEAAGSADITFEQAIAARTDDGNDDEDRLERHRERTRPLTPDSLDPKKNVIRHGQDSGVEAHMKAAAHKLVHAIIARQINDTDDDDDDDEDEGRKSQGDGINGHDGGKIGTPDHTDHTECLSQLHRNEHVRDIILALHDRITRKLQLQNRLQIVQRRRRSTASCLKKQPNGTVGTMSRRRGDDGNKGCSKTMI